MLLFSLIIATILWGSRAYSNLAWVIHTPSIDVAIIRQGKCMLPSNFYIDNSLQERDLINFSDILVLLLVILLFS